MLFLFVFGHIYLQYIYIHIFFLNFVYNIILGNSWFFWIAKVFFFFLHFRQWHCHNCQNNFFFFFLHFRQWYCHNCESIFFFFFYIFGNGIATIAKTFFFFFTFSAIVMSQLPKFIYFFNIFGNGIATIAKIIFFFFFFFFYIFGNAIPQLIFHKFFKLIIIKNVWFILKIF